jgi:hypothetical protein
MLPKILLTVLIVIAVWYGFRYVTRLSGRLGGGTRADPTVNQDPPPPAVEETSRCPICGTYVVTNRARRCDRSDCPYPR